MKALKEKRVSLRSLLRRGLVILSLFALAFAFASCGDSGGSGGGGDTQPTNGTTPPPPPPTAKFVERLEVMKHPNMYSYEAAAVELSGLQVAVYWNDNGAKVVEIVDVEDDETAARFYTDPPFATIGANSPGTSLTDMGSLSGQYTLFYNDPWGPEIGVPINIPAVRAIDPDDTVLTALTGKIPEVYEDLPIDTSGVKLRAVYVPISAGYGAKGSDGKYLGISSSRDDKDKKFSASSEPASDGSPAQEKALDDWLSGSYTTVTTGRVWKDYAWDGEGKAIKERKISPRPEVWEFKRALDDPYDVTLSYCASTTKSGAAYETDVLGDEKYAADVGAFNFVYKLEYVSGAANLKDFIADEEAINGEVNWVKELQKADVRFKVIYYTGASHTIASYERPIGMSEYIKAMYTMGPVYDEDGNYVTDAPKATVPRIRGYTGNKNINTLQTKTQAGKTVEYYIHTILGAVIEDYLDDAVLQCYYYYPGIRGEKGRGTYDETREAGTGPGTGDNSGRVIVNAANVPLTDKIFIFDSIEAKRIANTEPNKNPQVQYGVTQPQAFLNNLQKLWEVVYVYVNPNDSSKTKQSDPIDWRPAKVDADNPNSAFKATGAATLSTPPKASDSWSNISADPGDIETVDIYFDLPDSDYGNDSIEFEYDVIS